MSGRAFHYRWEWRLNSSPAALWPLVADTNRFNHDTGVPSLERGAHKSVRNGRRRLGVSRYGLHIEWEEEPFEWVRPQRFGVVRRYRRGPLREMRILVELSPQPDGGTAVVYQVWAQPKGILGLTAIPVQIGLVQRRHFGAVFHQYDHEAAQPASAGVERAHVHLAPGAEKRLAAGRAALVAQGIDPSLVARLAETIAHGEDLDVFRMRPYLLADRWSAPRRRVLELFLYATRAGMLDSRWEILCPLCRGTEGAATTLDGVSSRVHCESCNIDYTVNFDRLVELVFRPNTGIRLLDVGEFCVGGPGVTPHIVVQQLLAPDEERRLTLPLEEGRYRFRTLGTAGTLLVEVGPGGLEAATIAVDDDARPEAELQLSTVAALTLRNDTPREQLCILERTVWSDGAATAADVTRLQVFRDLFAHEALRPGEQISVGSLSILFTDLRGSTQLYREIGDASAFGRVLDHFEVLRTAIAEEEGSLVKTIGDAVMAVFPRPVAGVRAMLRAQATLANPPGDLLPLLLKAGVHHGPCIAVTLNDRLDYFGSTVNMAARLEGLSTGGDVVITDAIHDDPEIAELLGEERSDFIAEPFEATLKGFDQPVRLWRVSWRVHAAQEHSGEIVAADGMAR
jgi:class 3 adenylate cyclase